MVLHFFFLSLSRVLTFSAFFFRCEIEHSEWQIRAFLADLFRLRWEIPLPRLSLGITDQYYEC